LERTEGIEGRKEERKEGKNLRQEGRKEEIEGRKDEREEGRKEERN
jgi:hypothetical protein